MLNRMLGRIHFRATKLAALGLLAALAAAGSGVASAAQDAATKPAQAAPPVKKQLSFPQADTSKMPRLVRSRFDTLRRTLESEPADLSRVVTAAALLYVHGEPRDAVGYLEKALELSTTELAIYHLLGIFYEKAGDPTKAIAHYQKAIELEPRFSISKVRLALLIIDKEPAQARTLLEAALAIEPKDARAQCALARCLAASGDKAGAIDALRKALALFPVYKEAHERLADLLAAEGKTAEAAAHRKVAESGYEAPYADSLYFELLELGMEVQTLIQMANRHAASGNLQRAETMLTEAIEIEGRGTSAREAMAGIKFRAGRFEEAISMINSVIGSAPTAPGPRAQLGEALYRAGRSKEAIEAFTKAAELAPQEGRYRYRLAIVHYSDKNLQAALPEFAKASELNPKLVEARLGYAQTASQLKQYDVAAKAFEEGLRDNPDNALLQNAAAWFFATIPSDAHRNAKEAVRLAELACKAVKDEQHEFLDTLAAAYANDGRFDDATARTRAAVEKVAAAISAATDGPERERLNKLKADYESRLKLWAEKKPYREESH